ncbi:hypothetical protein DUI87_18744 [Hirundo rustica rustica]|uniref:ribonuclease H n=1 Tax=Hirundo rustica rustica TaxID=333673 RepID=A0A3M0JXQ5_HIRRU|nr:hypothetical protein DUI87_18744 [Hirundo rustica rustica]
MRHQTQSWKILSGVGNGRTKEFSAPIDWNFPPEQSQNPAEVQKYLKEKYDDNSNEKNLIVRSWFLAYAYQCRPQFAFTWMAVQYTWNQLPQGWKHSPTICHGLIQAALEKGEALEHLQYINDIIVLGNTAMEVVEKGENVARGHEKNDTHS